MASNQEQDLSASFERQSTVASASVSSKSERAIESASDEKPPAAAVAPIEMSPFKRIVVFVSLALTMLLASLDLTIVTTAIPKIAHQFEALSDASWIATAYFLTTTALQPLYGRLSDTFGRVPTLIFSIVVFIAGSAVCGWANSIGVLIFGRAFQGVGGAGLVALVFIIISDVTTEEQRPAYLGVLGAVWSLASVIGPVLGGVFSDKASWRWAFLINLPVAGVVLLIVIFLLRLPQPTGSLMSKLRKVDFLGSMVLIGSVVMLMLALTWGGKNFPWNSVRVICLLVFGVVGLAVFMVVEWKTKADPIVPIHLFRHRNISLSVIGQFFMGVAMFSPLFFIPIWYTIVKNSSAISSGLHLLPYLLSLSLMSVVSGFVVTKYGRYRAMVIIGTAIFVLGVGLLILFDEKTSSGKQIGFMFIAGFGLGLNIQILLIVVQAAAPKEYMAATTTLFLFMRVLGSSIGIAILQSVLQNALVPKINDLVTLHPQYASQILASVNDQAIIYHSGLPEDVRTMLVHAYVLALKKVFVATVPFAAASWLLTLPLEHIPLTPDIKVGVAE